MSALTLDLYSLYAGQRQNGLKPYQAARYVVEVVDYTHSLKPSQQAKAINKMINLFERGEK